MRRKARLPLGEPPGQTGPMFAHTCSSCGHRSLMLPEFITALTNTPSGIVVQFTCWCGADQALLTGRTADHRAREARAA